MVLTHGISAVTFFIGGMYYCILQASIDDLLPELGTPQERGYRKFFARAVKFQLFMTFVLMFIGAAVYSSTMDNQGVSSDNVNQTETMTGEVDYSPEVKLVIFAMAMFEISLLITFMSTFVTFYSSFQTTLFAVVVMDSEKRYDIQTISQEIHVTSAGASTTIVAHPQALSGSPSINFNVDVEMTNSEEEKVSNVESNLRSSSS